MFTVHNSRGRDGCDHSLVAERRGNHRYNLLDDVRRLWGRVLFEVVVSP